jgi:putative colanic acid biosynthesis glycosyltransferase
MRFSIITVTLNNLEGLIRTIKSVSIQSFRDFQLMVIDGGSVDGSVPWLIELANKNKYINVVSGSDEGLYDAMNKGIRLSTGEYFIFLNSGDSFFSSDSLERIQAAALERENPHFIFGDTIELIDGHLFYKKARSQKFVLYGMFAHHQSMVYSSDIIKKNSLTFNLLYSLAADWDFTIRFLNLSGNILRLHFPISVFVAGGISSNYFLGLQEQFKIRKSVFKLSSFSCGVFFIFHFLLNFIRSVLPSIYNLFRFKEFAGQQNE